MNNREYLKPVHAQWSGAYDTDSTFDDPLYDWVEEMPGDTRTIRSQYQDLYDDTVYWAKKMEDGIIYYSQDEIFSTDKLDATHIIIFLK